MATETRVDRLARRLASVDADIVSPRPAPAATIDAAFDNLARAVGLPITRRGALWAAGGAIVAGSLLRPARAGAVQAHAADCWPGGPKVCEQNGRRVCVPSNLECCSNDNCAIACPYPWRSCGGPAICNDTARMCTDTTAPGYDKAKTRFCSQDVEVTNGCVPAGKSRARRGWCCKAAEACGTEFGECQCTTPCGSECCRKGEDCVGLGFLRGSQCKPACPRGWHHDAHACVCDTGQTCGTRCCPEGSACSGSTCVKPADPDKLPSIFDAFKNFGDVASQSSATHGGGGGRGRARRVRVAQSATPAGAALLGLATVNAQGVAAGVAFTDGRVDRSYRRKVTAARPASLRIAPGAGLDQRAASALEALIDAEGSGFAQSMAAATALARARGAVGAHDLKAARRQVLAAARFADGAARRLRSVPSLRRAAAAALTSTGAAEVVVAPSDVLDLQSSVRATGVPADLRDQLRRVGVSGKDLAGVRDALLVNSAGGAVLIAPLADPGRTRNIKAIATELGAFARKARRSPLTRSRPKPRRFTPRAGKSAGRR